MAIDVPLFLEVLGVEALNGVVRPLGSTVFDLVHLPDSTFFAGGFTWAHLLRFTPTFSCFTSNWNTSYAKRLLVVMISYLLLTNGHHDQLLLLQLDAEKQSFSGDQCVIQEVGFPYADVAFFIGRCRNDIP
ncbi:hypothetical protein Tco_0643369 [Tanacetum coccineum]